MKNTATKTLYAVMIADKWQIIREGFKTWNAAYEWALSIDYGQYENDGGLVVCSYTA